MNIQTLSKPVIRLYEPQDSRKLCSFNVHNKIFGDLNIDVKRDNVGFENFIIVLKNRLNKTLGHELIRLNKDCQEIEGLYLHVEPEYRKRHHFGEILRLASIIEMIENNVQTLKIASKNSAVYFHSKYKFTPAISSFDERNNVLESIIQNQQKGFESIVEVAKEILEKIKKATTGDEQRELREQTNMLTEIYINEVMKTKDLYKSHPFHFGLSMELTRDSILKNREFFNSLFKKHGIDYQI